MSPLPQAAAGERDASYWHLCSNMNKLDTAFWGKSKVISNAKIFIGENWLALAEVVLKSQGLGRALFIQWVLKWPVTAFHKMVYLIKG